MELFTPDFGLIFWMFVSVAVLFVILWKLAWPIIIKSIDSRADLIDKGVEYAQNAKEQLDHAREEADKYIAEARKQQQEMLREIEKMKSQLAEEAKANADKIYQQRVAESELAIQQMRKEAEQDFRNQVSDFALTIAEKVVRKEMADSQAQSRLVNSLLDEIETNN
jgi:F-type H+-transporting ATPase subunit b